MLEVAFAKPGLPKSGALVLALGMSVPPAAAGVRVALDQATGGLIGRALDVAEFKGKPGQTATILAPGAGLSRVVAVGLGEPGERANTAIEEAGGHAAAAVAREEHASIAADELPPAQAAHFAFGAVLRAYRFDRYRTNEKPEDKPRLAKLTVLTTNVAAAKRAWERLKPVAEGVFVARDLVTEPPNVLNPAEFARRIEALGALGLAVEVFGPKELAELGFGALLGVSQGSLNEPRMVVMRWSGASGSPAAAPTDAPAATAPAPARRGRAKAAPTPAPTPAPEEPAGADVASGPVAFIGKGVTFDTGGISIKPAAGMEDMKFDMAGAAAVVGAMAALAGRRARVDAVGVVGLVENMPSGSAQRPSDVVTTHSGQTVEIINTDAEGRMVLADVLSYCQQRFRPRFMIDLATLTGAIIVALGHEHAGCFSNDDALAQHLLDAGIASGEKLWRMPMGEAYDKQLKSEIADMKHVGGRPGSAITAAHFIQRFVRGAPWAHLDIAGMAWASKDLPVVPKGATGFGVRLLEGLVAARYEDAKDAS